MNGQTPGTEADKGPKKSIGQQFKDKLEARGIKPPEGDLTVSGDSPFQAATDAEIAAERGTDTTGGTTDANQTQAGADGAATGADAGAAQGAPAPGTDGSAGAAGAAAAATGGAAADAAGGSAGTGAAAGTHAAGAGAVPAGAAVVDSATGAPVTGAVAAEPEYVDVEIDDPDAGRTIKARVPKDYAEPAKGGWLRRADYTRKTQFLSKYRPTLEPLIASGEMEYVEPLIRLATTSAPFAQAVVELAQQAMAGQPLRYGVPAAQPAQPAAGAQPGTQPGAAAGGAAPILDVNAALRQISEANPNLDPLALEALGAALPGLLAPVLSKLDTVTQRLSAEDQQRAEAQRQQVQAQQQARENQQFALEARAAFQQAFPAEFTGADTDFATLGKVYDYAQRSGLVALHGKLGGMFAAKRAMDAAAAEYTPSAAAAGIAARTSLDELNARSQARAASDAVAAGIAPGSAGGGAATGAPAGAVALKGAQLRDAKGKLLSTSQILRKVQDANAHLFG